MSMPQDRCPDFAPDCLAGRQALITGGSGALGERLMRRLIAHGAQVSNLDPSPSALDSPAHRHIRLDIADTLALEQWARGHAHPARGYDLLFCHAGIVLPGSVDDYAPDDWRKTFSLNVDAHYRLVQLMLPYLHASEASPARIVFTSSWVSTTPWPGNGAYSPSKAAVDMMARCLARELADRHIRVNILSPGIVGAGMALRQWESDPDYRQRAQRAIPVGALQSPDSVADAALFLSIGSSHYLSGSNLVVDGGASLYPMI